MSSVLEGLSHNYPNVKFVKVNIDDENGTLSKIADKYKVSLVPAFMAFKGGEQPIDQMKGAVPSKLQVSLSFTVFLNVFTDALFRQ
jgi:thioredoxin-like negative regulator of GroEL